MTLTSKQRAFLISKAANIKASFALGKSSLTPEITEAINEYFGNNELLKVSVLNNCDDDPTELGRILSERTHSVLVKVIGKKIILYKRDRENPKLELPR